MFLFPSLHRLNLTSLKGMIVSFLGVRGSFPGPSSQVDIPVFIWPHKYVLECGWPREDVIVLGIVIYFSKL